MNRKLMFAIAWLVILTSTTALASGVQPTTTEPVTQGSQQVIESQFLTRDGSRLLLNGEEFRAIGANHADLIWSFIDNNFIAENGTKVIEDAAKWEIKILRYSAIGCGPSARPFIELWKNDSDEFWLRYDNLVGIASRLNVYLLPCLVWTTNLCEPFAYIAHFNGTDYNQTLEEIQELFDIDSNTSKLFRDFTAQFVEHYKDNSTILMWEVGNELDLTCNNPNRPNEGYTTVSTLRAFLSNTTEHIRSLDPHKRPVSSGMAKIPHVYKELNLTDMISEFIGFYNDTSVDVISIHTYQNDDETLYGRTDSTTTYNVTEETYINSLFDASISRLGKPMIIGEFGDDLEERPQSTFNVQVLETALQVNISLSLIWEWRVPADRDHDRQRFNVDPDKTLRMTKTLRDYSALMQTSLTRYDCDATVQGFNYTVILLSNSSVSDFQMDRPERISFNVTEESGTGICRLSIPDEISLSCTDDYHVEIDGGEPNYHNTWTNCSYGFIFLTYNHSTRKVAITPEFPPTLFPLAFITTTLLIAIICKRRKQPA
jgi:hypothetical protein